MMHSAALLVGSQAPQALCVMVYAMLKRFARSKRDELTIDKMTDSLERELCMRECRRVPG